MQTSGETPNGPTGKDACATIRSTVALMTDPLAPAGKIKACSHALNLILAVLAGSDSSGGRGQSCRSASCNGVSSQPKHAERFKKGHPNNEKNSSNLDWLYPGLSFISGRIPNSYTDSKSISYSISRRLHKRHYCLL